MHRSEAAAFGPEVRGLALVEAGSSKKEFAAIGVEADIHLSRRRLAIHQHSALRWQGDILNNVAGCQNILED